MAKSPFLEKYYKPWSITWIIQRSILVLKQRRLPQISWHNLVVDYKFTRQVRRNLRKHKAGTGSDNVRLFSGLPYFDYDRFELPQIITCKDHLPDQLSNLNRYFDHVYVINLERRADRRLDMIQKLTRLNIQAEFFATEDGNTPEIIREYQEYLEKPIDTEKAHELEKKLKRKVIYSPGSWAYLKAHKKLLLDAEKNRYTRILCFDDDVVFARDFESKFARITSLIPQTWKLFYLGASQHSWIQGEDLEFPGDHGEEMSGDSYYKALNTDGGFAVGIHRSAFSFLQEEITKMNCSFDSGALRAVARKYRGKCFVAYPNLVIADVRESDIRISRSQNSFARTVRWNLDDYSYPHRNDLVSVIMPAYNAEKTIEMSLRSVMNQSYKELEIIVVDDGSTDRTAEIVSLLAKEDSRIRLIASPQNAGCYSARNLGLQQCTGKYITFHDADDISLKDRLQRQLIYHYLGDCTFSVMRNIRSRLDPTETKDVDQDNLILKALQQKASQQSVLSEYRDNPNIGLMTTMYNRELFEELGLFWENRFGADAEFPERILFHKAGITGGKDFRKLLGYLSSIESIPGLFRRIDTIGILSPEMTEQNLTRKYQTPEREAFEQKWRRRLQGLEEYEYPTLLQ
jgi:hypothetical protein